VPQEDPAINLATTDRYASPFSIIAFSVALGIGFVAIPLSALASGYDAATVGFLTAASAVAQLVGRSQVTWFLARVADRWLITAAALLLAGTYALLFISTSLPVFVAAMVALGMARAFYWTGSQTHAVRSRDNPVRALAIMNTFSGIGTVCGPVLGGVLIAASEQMALGAAVGGSLLAAVTAIGLRPFPTYDRGRPQGEPRVWRRPGVDMACWASFAGGGWRGLLNSYVPVVLVGAGQASTTIGGLLSFAEGVSIAATAGLVRFPRRHVRAGLLVGVLAVGGSLALIPFAAHHVAIAALLLGVSGVGGGTVTTLGPAAAANSVPPGQLGAAIAVTGTFRALGLLALPFGIAATLVAVPLTSAMVVAAVATSVPTLLVDLRGRSRRRETRPVS
jgi:predicted MFS family arabinose efflux permease